MAATSVRRRSAAAVRQRTRSGSRRVVCWLLAQPPRQSQRTTPRDSRRTGVLVAQPPRQSQRTTPRGSRRTGVLVAHPPRQSQRTTPRGSRRTGVLVAHPPRQSQRTTPRGSRRTGVFSLVALDRRSPRCVCWLLWCPVRQSKAHRKTLMAPVGGLVHWCRSCAEKLVCCFVLLYKAIHRVPTRRTNVFFSSFFCFFLL